MGMYDTFKRDEDLEKEGAWLDYSDGDSGFAIKILPSSDTNKEYIKVLEQKTRKFRKAIQHNMLPFEKNRAIMIEVFAKTIVIGWKTYCKKKKEFIEGIEDPKGKIIEFNYDNVVKTFTALPDLFKDVVEQADERSVFQKDQIEEEVKNSASSSNTS